MLNSMNTFNTNISDREKRFFKKPQSIAEFETENQQVYSMSL